MCVYNTKKLRDKKYDAVIYKLQGTYVSIVGQVKEVLPHCDADNETIPFLYLIMCCICINIDADYSVLSEYFLSQIEDYSDKDDVLSYIDDRLEKYGAILENRKCRGLWLFEKYEFEDPITCIITTFGDFLVSPSYANDIHHAPLTLIGLSVREKFSKVMYKTVYPLIGDLAEFIEIFFTRLK